jgi:hypothetical protein
VGWVPFLDGVSVNHHTRWPHQNLRVHEHYPARFAVSEADTPKHFY